MKMRRGKSMLNYYEKLAEKMLELAWTMDGLPDQHLKLILIPFGG